MTTLNPKKNAFEHKLTSGSRKRQRVARPSRTGWIYRQTVSSAPPRAGRTHLMLLQLKKITNKPPTNNTVFYNTTRISSLICLGDKMFIRIGNQYVPKTKQVCDRDSPREEYCLFMNTENIGEHSNRWMVVETYLWGRRYIIRKGV